MSRRLLLAGLMGLTLGLPASFATPAEDFEALAARTPWKDENGRETRSFELPGGIVIRQERRGDHVSTMGFDNSEGGAVLCSAQVLMAMQVEEEMCPGQDGEWAREIRSALDRVYSFIGANSLTPMTRDTLMADTANAMAKLREETRKVYGQSGAAADICHTIAQRGFGRRIKQQGIEAFRAGLDKLLAVPRLPVMNPCF